MGKELYRRFCDPSTMRMDCRTFTTWMRSARVDAADEHLGGCAPFTVSSKKKRTAQQRSLSIKKKSLEWMTTSWQYYQAVRLHVVKQGSAATHFDDRYSPMPRLDFPTIDGRNSPMPHVWIFRQSQRARSQPHRKLLFRLFFRMGILRTALPCTYITSLGRDKGVILRYWMQVIRRRYVRGDQEIYAA